MPSPATRKDIQAIIERDCTTNLPLLFLDPTNPRKKYTIEEWYSLHHRDFQVRLFLSAVRVQGNTVWVRNHFSDYMQTSSHLNYVRDIFKALTVSKNFTAAKSTLTDLLNICFSLPPSDYYSFATTVASGLSGFGHNVEFEIDDAMLSDPHELRLARLKLCYIMDVIFTQVSLKRLLIDEKATNAFRLVHCMTLRNHNKTPLIYAVFSFLLQVCLAGYVAAETVMSGARSYNLNMFPLAVLTLIYSSLITYPLVIGDDYRIYDSAFGANKFGPLRCMDKIVNRYLPIFLLASGFSVIMLQESFIEAVLNTTALLFIPEIDDNLPTALGFNEDCIIQNFLIGEAMRKLDDVISLSENGMKGRLTLRQDPTRSMGVKFNDYYLTNIKEGGCELKQGVIYQPYQVKRATESGRGYHIDPNNFVTEECLVKKILWSYTENAQTTEPRIGYLKLIKLNGEEIVICRKKLATHSGNFRHSTRGYINTKHDGNIIVSDFRHTLEGVFIITTFQMSNDIIRLRVCGCPDAQSFMDAFEYYSLWPISDNARKLLEKAASQEAEADAVDTHAADAHDRYLKCSSDESLCSEYSMESYVRSVQ